ncbi:retrovirus-related Pol polyprotein from transposon 17.6 [Trichonephila clavipes]|nr:retrovirus-related Pol polyprotein from transposon 17.6 [Trichonephila clavipes]
MSEKALVDHIFIILEPQVQDYVEVGNPQSTVQLLEVLSKFEERYSYKAMLGSGNSDNVERRGCYERKMSNADDSRRNWRNSEVVRRPSNGKNDYRDKPGLTHVLYHEIDTGDKPSVSRPYRYDRAQKAFDVVKADITKVPVLKLPDFKMPFELFMDDSSIGVGEVLNQEQGPVVFTSRTLSSAERNYTVTERECLAVVWALNKFRTYLGSLPIKVITDHAALTRLTHSKDMSSRMIRWILKLAEFNIEWKNRPGTQNVVWTFCQGTLLKV